ncbi:swr complex subunit [Coniosporium apollinis]|uniref:SWR1-complex protein 5 n=1 Tax=Coniosporium apollinis TaxID=61459 RepID=A0ABQ9P0P9_9PEZI|nr:swr complex subunit [Coniosporium apollinis]
MADHDQPLAIDDREDYNSASDEDFSPTAEPASDAESASSSDNEASTAKSRGTKRKRRTVIVEAELDSGDEEAVKEYQAHKEDDSGGEGGLIKTRAQRRAEVQEKKQLATAGGATVDVNALWAQMLAAPVGRPPESRVDVGKEAGKEEPHKADSSVAAASNADVELGEDDTITITRTYTFAGETHTEEKRVPKSSEEARLYLASHRATETQGDANEPASIPANSPIRRPLRRPSRFDPNPSGEIKGLPASVQLTWRQRNQGLQPASVAKDNVFAKPTARAKTKLTKAPEKLNTVDKSRMDWVQHVDQEGLADELDVYGKSKEAYGARQSFLAQAELRREEEARDLRMKGQG